jgi:hypothetical protein
MSKRPAEHSEEEEDRLKSGQRPISNGHDEMGEFEDEFEDEFESEDEIFEAGVDGRPDEEREAEERDGVRVTMKLECGSFANLDHSYGGRPGHIHTRQTQALKRRDTRSRQFSI